MWTAYALSVSRGEEAFSSGQVLIISKLLIAYFVYLIFFFGWVDCKLYPYQVLFGYTSNFVLFMNSVCIIIVSKETWLTTLWYCVFGTGCHQTRFLPSLSVPNKIIFLITYMALNCFCFDDHIQYRKNKKIINSDSFN